MNFKELEKEYIQCLSSLYHADEAKAIFDIAATTILRINHHQLINQNEISVEDSDELIKNLSALKTGKPVQQVLGETIFYGLPFKINEHVLIPRPETEELVDWIIKEIKDKKKSLLDIGTGSGCIPVSIKKYIPNLDISAMDVSKNALKTAFENAELNKTTINFIEADILNHSAEEKYDVIISNPPYIRELEKTGMHKNVLDYEPHVALFVPDENPLIFYNAIADFALKNLNPNGYLFFEINEFLWAETLQVLMDRKFKNIELRKDIQGKDRMVMARINP